MKLPIGLWMQSFTPFQSVSLVSRPLQGDFLEQERLIECRLAAGQEQLPCERRECLLAPFDTSFTINWSFHSTLMLLVLSRFTFLTFPPFLFVLFLPLFFQRELSPPSTSSAFSLFSLAVLGSKKRSRQSNDRNQCVFYTNISGGFVGMLLIVY